MAKRNAPKTDAVKAALLAKGRPWERAVKPGDYLKTGSLLLDLACTGRADGGFAKGRYFRLIGDSSTGKTFLSLTCFAEAARNPAFKDYRLIFYDKEGGALMDFARFFGQAMADRIEVVTSADIPNLEHFFYHLDDQLNKGPLIAVVDSWESLVPRDDDKKFEEEKTAARKGTKITGTYGMAKAKRSSQDMRRVNDKLQTTGSILIGISQTRANIDPMSHETRTVGGGMAQKFYAALEIWTSPLGKLTKTIKGNYVQIGIRVKAKIKKNRLSGKEWDIEIPIYWSHGIDDVGSLVDYLVQWKHWPRESEDRDPTKGKITAVEFEFAGGREAIIKRIEADGLVPDLRGIVTDVWETVVEAAQVERQPRY